MLKINSLLICFLLCLACDSRPDKSVAVSTPNNAPRIENNAADRLLELQLRVQRQPRDSVLKKQWLGSARRDRWLFIWGVARRGQTNRAMVERALQADARRWVLAGRRPASTGTMTRGTVSGALTELRRITRGDSVCVLYAYKIR